jgi:hypothetical protein
MPYVSAIDDEPEAGNDNLNLAEWRAIRGRVEMVAKVLDLSGLSPSPPIMQPWLYPARSRFLDATVIAAPSRGRDRPKPFRSE